ncbi:hypothetical protein NE237_010870 [Protea cynaroides]|uniref:Uncharacterized protein n=1 Tax=Protea cynaroides TaxID=273540 RepID=A0A9Q0L0M4_9MAGN|nr:hypothetical protein NE237_010870 [Protea cynaroides]
MTGRTTSSAKFREGIDMVIPPGEEVLLLAVGTSNLVSAPVMDVSAPGFDLNQENTNGGYQEGRDGRGIRRQYQSQAGRKGKRWTWQEKGKEVMGQQGELEHFPETDRRGVGQGSAVDVAGHIPSGPAIGGHPKEDNLSDSIVGTNSQSVVVTLCFRVYLALPIERDNQSFQF